MKKLTATQQRILDYLRECSQGGLPPSVREICAATGLKSTSTVHAHLQVLEREGYISRDAGLNRAIHLTDEVPVVQVPLVGRVTAGVPILAVEEILTYIPISGDCKRGRELFALRVQGDSMIEAGILDEDIVVCEKTPSADNGDIVVALIEDEATVKRIYRENGHVRLQPENPCYEPIITNNVSVLGRVVACLRYYS